MHRHSILFFNRVYPSASSSSGQLLKELAGMLAQAGWEVTIVTARADGAAKSEIVAGVRVERPGLPLSIDAGIEDDRYLLLKLFQN